MTNIFQIAVERLVDIGFYNFFLPFVLFAVVMYAVLKKTQFLGESPMIIGLISVIVGLFVFGTPVLVGVDISAGLTGFLTQTAITILVFFMAFLIISFFYPNVTEKITEIFKPPGPGGWLFWVVIGIAATFGLFVFVGKPISALMKSLRIPSELLTMTVVVVIVLIVFIILAVSRGVEK